jgi:cell division transport system permease protein
MLGLLGMLLLNAQKLSQNIKENIGFQIILNDNAKPSDIDKLKLNIETANYCKSINLIDKDSAAQKLQTDLGEDFIAFLGYNPLLASINVKLKAAFANTEQMDKIAASLQTNETIKEIIYQKSLIGEINDNVNKIGIIILFFSALLMFIALALINNTIRLTIYSKRFIIKTMQLVGATKGFIRAPFIIKGIRQGIYGAIIAILALLIVLYFAQQQLPELKELQDIKMLLSLFGIVIVLGIIISWISTSLAVRKYLRLKTGELYY